MSDVDFLHICRSTASIIFPRRNYSADDSRLLYPWAKISGRVDRECLRRVLLETGLFKFTQSAVHLAYDWFSLDGAGLQSDSLSRFVMLNGKMGSLRNLVITNAAALTDEGETTTFRYVLRRLFPSKKVLSENFQY